MDATGVSGAFVHRFFWGEVSDAPSSPSLPSVPVANLREGVTSPAFRSRDDVSRGFSAEDVEMGGREGAACEEDADVPLYSLAGIDRLEDRELKDRSGCVPDDKADASACKANAPDILSV
jgi:hypothetical protein